ncbi:MAG: Crp/Fnr family transcriptional regulator [Bacteroidota bacterium]
MSDDITENPAAVTSPRVRALVGRSRHLGELPTEVKDRLAAAASLRHFCAGEVIYVEGEPARNIYLLESGWVKCTRMTREGREAALIFLAPNEVFGDIGVFTGTAYVSTAVALEEADAWAIPAGTVLGLVSQSPALASAVIRMLGDRVLYYIGLVEDLALRSVEARLANNLLRHAEAADGRLLVPRRNWTTLNEMAVRMGTVRDVLSRALKTLESQGLLRVEKEAIILVDPQGLRERGSL